MWASAVFVYWQGFSLVVQDDINGLTDSGEAVWSVWYPPTANRGTGANHHNSSNHDEVPCFSLTCSPSSLHGFAEGQLMTRVSSHACTSPWDPPGPHFVPLCKLCGSLLLILACLQEIPTNPANLYLLSHEMQHVLYFWICDEEKANP